MNNPNSFSNNEKLENPETGLEDVESFEEHLEEIKENKNPDNPESEVEEQYDLDSEVDIFIAEHPGYQLYSKGEKSAILKDLDGKVGIVSEYIDIGNSLENSEELQKLEINHSERIELETTISCLAIDLAKIDAARDVDEQSERVVKAVEYYDKLTAIVDDPNESKEKKALIEGLLTELNGKDLNLVASRGKIDKQFNEKLSDEEDEDDRENEDKEREGFMEELEEAKQDLRKALFDLDESRSGCEKILRDIEEVTSGGPIDVDELRTQLYRLRVAFDEFVSQTRITKSKGESYQDMVFENSDSPFSDGKHYLSEDEARPLGLYAINALEKAEKAINQVHDYEEQIDAIQKYISQKEDIE